MTVTKVIDMKKKHKMKKIKVIFTFCIIACLFNTVSASNHKQQIETIISIEKRLANALLIEESGQLLLALLNTEKLFQENNQHKEVSIAYASQLTKLNQAEKAQRVIQPLAKISADDWRVWFWLGSAQLLQNDLENASNSLSKALALNGQEISIWIQKAIVEQEKGNSKAALNFLQVANNLQPNNPDVLINYAYANEAEGEINKAIKLYRYFLQLSASDNTKGALRSEIMLRLVQISSTQSLVDEDLAKQF